MTYDDKTKSLFSGDVFGGLTYDWSLYAGEYYTEAMKAFHEDYMASSPHLKEAMIRLSPLQIDRILSQHGSVIGQNVSKPIAFLKNLKYGLTLMQPSVEPARGAAPTALKGSYHDLIAFVIEREKRVLGLEKTVATAKEVPGLEVDDRGNILSVQGDGKDILGRLLDRFDARWGIWTVLNVKMALRAMAHNYKLELPNL